MNNIANLDNGKVIHLVIRPVDAPHNPMNGNKLYQLFYMGVRIIIYIYILYYL